MTRASVGVLVAMLAILLVGCDPQAPPTDETDAAPGTPDRQEAEERIEDAQ
jgi:hypothetical protein